MLVVAHLPHLHRQQSCKHLPIRLRIVIAAMLMHQKRVRHLLPNIREDVERLQFCNRAVDHAASLCRIHLGRGSREGSSGHSHGCRSSIQP